ncbi:MAG: FAD-dependent oxidoreductase [Pseudomonadota bacterium]
MTSVSTYDLVVVGAGVFGLWVAKRAVEAGMRVALVEKNSVGSGASATPLGALTAHSPDRWNAKKQFQLDALIELPGEIDRLEDETGVLTGYRRCGRVMPIRSDAFLAQLPARSEGARAHWDGRSYEVVRNAPSGDWLDAAAAPLGYVHDTLAARISARRYTRALADWLASRATLLEGVGYEGWADAARLSDGRRLATGAVVLAHGVGVFDAIRDLTGAEIGRGSPGRVALARIRKASDLDLSARPLIYDGGAYIVPQGVDTVSLGGFDDYDGHPATVRSEVDPRFARLIALCPRLDGAEILQWWAGVRPKCRLRDPLVGKAPVDGPIWLAAGGFKIGLGVAHRLASALIAEINGSAGPRLPETFGIRHHFGRL